jgi:hypothetical protein
MPFQLAKNKLMIGGGLLVLLIIVAVVVAMMMMKKKSSQPVQPQPVKVKNTYLSFVYKGNTYYLVLNNGSPVSVTTNIMNATPVVLVPKVLAAIGGMPAQNVNAIQTTSGQFVNLTYSASQNVINANENMVSISNAFYYNSSGTFATMIINSANAIQTYFADLANENNLQYWYIAYFNGSSFSFNPAAAGYVVVRPVIQ